MARRFLSVLIESSVTKYSDSNAKFYSSVFVFGRSLLYIGFGYFPNKNEKMSLGGTFVSLITGFVIQRWLHLLVLQLYNWFYDTTAEVCGAKIRSLKNQQPKGIPTQIKILCPFRN